MNTIQRLNLQHLEEIASFEKMCFPIDFWPAEDLREMLKDEKAIYYAILNDDKIIASIFIYNWQGKKDYIKIMNLAVHSDYRKQGLAKKLLDYVEKEMSEVGMLRFCGETRASNIPMQKTFEKCGYKLDKIEEDYYDNPSESAFKYVLQL